MIASLKRIAEQACIEKIRQGVLFGYKSYQRNYGGLVKLYETIEKGKLKDHVERALGSFLNEKIKKGEVTIGEYLNISTPVSPLPNSLFQLELEVKKLLRNIVQ